MPNAVSFERSHSILIDAAPESILDYVTNPNSWPNWIAASHHIESEDRPLKQGDTFRELWRTKTGEVELNWSVVNDTAGKFWVGEAATDFIGKIIVRYDVERVGDQTKFTRTMMNPSRPKPPTEDMIRRMDEEAEISLANIKRQVEG
jgi:Polyketide cyclase / dehydrase and lipid transport